MQDEKVHTNLLWILSLALGATLRGVQPPNVLLRVFLCGLLGLSCVFLFRLADPLGRVSLLGDDETLQRALSGHLSTLEPPPPPVNLPVKETRGNRVKDHRGGKSFAGPPLLTLKTLHFSTLKFLKLDMNTASGQVCVLLGGCFLSLLQRIVRGTSLAGSNTLSLDVLVSKSETKGE